MSAPATTQTQMPTPAQYCEDPSKYKDRVPEQYRASFDSACEMLRAMREQDAEENTAAGKATKIGTSIGYMIRDMPYMLTVGMIMDPSQVSMFLLTDESYGLPRFQKFFQRHSQQLWKNVASEMKRFGFPWVNRMSSQGGKIITQSGARTLQRGYAKYLLNTVALNGAVRRGMQQTVTRLIGNVAKGSVRVFIALMRVIASLAMTGTALAIRALAFTNVLFMLSLVTMVVGMVVDTIDPCDLNKALDAQSFQSYTDGMDEMFRQYVIPNETAFYANGEYKYYAKWPIDVRVESLFPTIPSNKKKDDSDEEDTDLKKIEDRHMKEFGLTESRQDELISLKSEYEFLYLYNLKYNSYGQPLEMPPDFDPPDLTPQMMQVMGEQFVNFFGNNNPIVSKWLIKYSPLILTAIAFVLFLIFKYV
jgi:hypothetical protein